MKKISYGPVANFENRVPKNWWKSYFSETYYMADGDVVKNDFNTRREIDQLLKLVPLKKTDPIADFCCGQGRHCLELTRRGFTNVLGVDASPFLLKLAKQQTKKQSLEIPFIQSDIATVQLPKKMKCIYILGNSFGYFQSSQKNLKLLKHIKNNLLPGGKFVLDIMDGDLIRSHLVPFSAEWVDQNHIVCRERQLSKNGSRILSRRIFIHTQKGVLSDDFYAIDLYSREKIVALMKKAGFKKVKVYTSDPTRSKSNQNTGLMGHRMMILGENSI